VAEEIQPSTITPEALATFDKLDKIFLPEANRQLQKWFKATQKSARLVHYTTADGALKIINSKHFWMRNTNLMADYREVQHGFSIFQNFFANEAKRNRFTQVLDSCSTGVAVEALRVFDRAWQETVPFETYITCLSEHEDSEDAHGRLSMWRAFGGNAPRIAIVFNIPSDSLASVALGITFSPVAYLSEPAAHLVVDEVMENIDANRVFLKGLERDLLIRTVFRMLLSGVVCLKHEGFREEREWRAIYQPRIWSSSLMKQSTEVIAGIPQLVYKIPMDASESPQIADLDFAKLFDRLIVGPSPYVWPMYEALVDALLKAGVHDPGQRLIPSGIPIRA
jgi:hypothetical protein